MIYAKKCILSHHKDQRCEFAREFKKETHCMIIFEWYPDDPRVCHLTKCALDLNSRQRLRHRNKMLRNEKNVERKI